MMRALYTAATGMLAQQTNVDNISNNLSNVNTVGFKQEKQSLSLLLYQTFRRRQRVQTESRNRFRHRWDSERELRQSHPCTHRERCRRVRMITDFAIVGDGFFAVRCADGGDTLYQSGRFCVGSGNQRRYTDQSGRLSGAGQQ